MLKLPSLRTGNQETVGRERTPKKSDPARFPNRVPLKRGAFSAYVHIDSERTVLVVCATKLGTDELRRRSAAMST